MELTSDCINVTAVDRCERVGKSTTNFSSTLIFIQELNSVMSMLVLFILPGEFHSITISTQQSGSDRISTAAASCGIPGLEIQ